MCADIAELSVDQCKERYEGTKDKKFSAEFIVADCTKVISSREQVGLRHPSTLGGSRGGRDAIVPELHNIKK